MRRRCTCERLLYVATTCRFADRRKPPSASSKSQWHTQSSRTPRQVNVALTLHLCSLMSRCRPQKRAAYDRGGTAAVDLDDMMAVYSHHMPLVHLLMIHDLQNISVDDMGAFGGLVGGMFGECAVCLHRLRVRCRLAPTPYQSGNSRLVVTVTWHCRRGARCGHADCRLC